MNRLLSLVLLIVIAITPCMANAQPIVKETLRPPSTPLIACDPYFSIWSSADKLTDTATTHWTGKPQPLTSLARIDGSPYRLMGAEPKSVPALEQTGLRVLPTRTIYTFRSDEVQITLTFLTPSLPDDLDVLSRPLTYLTWEVQSRDNRAHAVSLYYDNTASLVVNTPDQMVAWSQEKVGATTALRMGSKDQPVLGKKGDDLRIDWGFLYAAPIREYRTQQVVAAQDVTRESFLAGKTLPEIDNRMPRAANDATPVMAFAFDLGRVGSNPVSRTLMLAYDDLYSIEYFQHKLRPYWRRNGTDAHKLLEQAASDFPNLQSKCKSFDAELMADLTRVGGEKYAALCALAYRQCFAANKIVADSKGMPLMFPKENFSNGCIATVDVIYPMEPFFLLLNPALVKASLQPILDYSASDHWTFSFAPHDLGTYPKANGQVYGGGESSERDQMPVEESGNMLILLAALARVEGNANYAAKYWPQITRWAEYLKSKGFDPENQLCTDDFAGHLAHNTNLSVKAIEALGAYGLLCEMRGLRGQAKAYRTLALELSAKWEMQANDGDHYRLTFDRAGTWSQKYNLVWDPILNINVFPASVSQREIAFYKRSQNRYGLPLDNRQAYTKLDWTVWSATLADNRKDFDALVAPLYAFLNASPSRVPMTDWFQTDTSKQTGFQARSVVGGVYIKMLRDPQTWAKWAARSPKLVGTWAPLPVPITFTTVVPTAQKQAISWRYTFEKPAEDWFRSEFEISQWKEGSAGFGTQGTPGAIVRTVWNTADIWMRREFNLDTVKSKNWQLLVHHDEDVEIYINGVLAGSAPGFTSSYDLLSLTPAGRAAFKPGKNVIAIHCHQTTGGQYIDAGIVDAPEAGD